VPPADKRRRQKENTARAREERQRALKRGRQRRTAIRVAVIAALAVGAVILLNVLTGNDSKKTDVATSETTASTTTTPDSTTTPPTTTKVQLTEAQKACNSETPPENPDRPTFKSAPPMTIDPAKKYTATFVTSCGTIVAELDPKQAPKGVNNFVFLAEKGFYDGLRFHRAVKDFVVQGGDPKGDGSGNAGYFVNTDERPPDNKYKIGDLAWAKGSADPDGTAGSQFFIITGQDGTTLPGQYGYIGHVTEGLDHAQTLESFHPETGDGLPTQPLYIYAVKITVT
jgi:cyclophilin family peptidyl-prolyl cis-trans isomerase